jgi:NAD(P)H-dependent FMN reductase
MDVRSFRRGVRVLCGCYNPRIALSRGIYRSVADCAGSFRIIGSDFLYSGRQANRPARRSISSQSGKLEKMTELRPLSIPVILGTTRKGRMSAHAARFVTTQLQGRAGVVTELIDIAELSLPVDDAGETIKDPEYNHSFPGLLKHVLDSCLKEYIHKAVGIVGVSAGLFGGTRMIENFQPVLRELGLVSIFWDVNFGSIGKVFDESGRLLDQAFIKRTDKFLSELIWMARVLRYGRENVPLE